MASGEWVVGSASDRNCGHRAYTAWSERPNVHTSRNAIQGDLKVEVFRECCGGPKRILVNSHARLYR